MTAPAPPRGGHTARVAAMPRAKRPGHGLVLALLTVLLCLCGAACSQDDPQKTPSATPTAPPTAATPGKRPAASAAAVTRRVLVVGDSLSISLGEQLEHALAGAPGVDFTRDGTRSTGLTRPELLDWPARLRDLTAQTPPDVAVIMLGANDAMPLTAADGSRTYFENPAWVEAYAAKARELVDICKQANPAAAIFWVGVPSMGEPTLGAGVKQINAALAAMCAATGCRFISTEAAFSDSEGRFTRHARDAATSETVPIRTADGVHLTDSGSRLLAGVVLQSLTGRELLPPTAGTNELLAQARDLRAVADEPRQPAKEPPAKAKPRASHKTYTIRNGDTLLTIAKRLGLDPDDIAAVNPGVDSRRLSIGQTLRLPVKR